MQSRGRAEMRVAHVFKIQKNHLPGIHTVLYKLLLNQAQHDRLAAAPDAGQHLNQLISDERTDAAHIGFSFNHKDSLLSETVHMITRVYLIFKIFFRFYQIYLINSVF